MVESQHPLDGPSFDAGRSGMAGPPRHCEQAIPSKPILQAFAGPTLSPALDRDHDPSLLTQRQFTAMTTEIGLWLYGDCASAQQELERCENWVRSMEARLSRFRDDSELSRLNRCSGQGPVRVSAELFEVVEESLKLAQGLPGFFDPTVLPALVRAGYGAGYAEGRINFQEVTLDARSLTISLPVGIAIDLGGVAKGWMADSLAQDLGRFGSCLVDLGGDLRAQGALAWPVALEDPGKPGQSVISFALQGSGVATSSLLKRCWGPGLHHLIDPRTGAPARSDLVAATVRAPTAVLAEGLAKSVLIMGAREGRSFLEKKGFRGVLFGKDGSIL